MGDTNTDPSEVKRYVTEENLTPIFTKIEQKLQNRYTKAATDAAIEEAIKNIPTSSGGSQQSIEPLTTDQVDSLIAIFADDSEG